MKTSLRGKRVLVTGANGFLGSWIIKKLLAEGAQITSLVYETIDLSLFKLEELEEQTNTIKGDILDFELIKKILREHEIDIIIHLAAQAINKSAVNSPYVTLETNIRGTYNVLEAVRVVSPETKIIIASSDKAYGIHTKMPYQEDYSLHGEYPYEVSKSCADLISKSYFNTYNLQICIVRSGNIYGEGDWHFSRVVPATISRIIKKLPPLLIDDTSRDYSYVEDIANGYLMLAKSMLDGLNGESFNFGSGKPLKAKSLINLIMKIMEQASSEISQSSEKRVEIPRQYLSIKKAKEVLGFETTTTIEDGLKKTIKWYTEHNNTIVNNRLED